MKQFLLWFFIGIKILTISSLQAQELEIERRLLKDTLKTGEHFRYILKVSYPVDTELFFPDSADVKAYKPLLFIDKVYAPTVTQDSISTDSVTYKFACLFETDSVHEIQLPIYIFKDGDTLIADTEPIRVHLAPSLQKPIDRATQVDLAENMEWRKLNYKFNYPYIVLAVLGLIIFIGGILWAFGDNFQRTYRLKRLRRQYDRFMHEYDEIIASEKDIAITEHGLSIWKAYLEDIKNQPFTSCTSKEIAQIIPNEELNVSLKNIDRAIYGNLFDEKTDEALKTLKDYASRIYDEKIKEIKDAR